MSEQSRGGRHREASAKLTLLIVDDEPIITKMLERLFRREFEVITAFNGQDALDIFLERRPQMVLTDHRMPGMTGIEMVKRAKKEAPETVFIVLSGFSDMDAMVEAINHHLLYRYISKPWDQDELISILRAGREHYMQAIASG